MFQVSTFIQLGIVWELIFFVMTPLFRPARDLKLGNKFSPRAFMQYKQKLWQSADLHLVSVFCRGRGSLVSRQRSEIVGIPSWGLASLTSFFQIGKAHQAFTIQTARGEHQAGRLRLAMSSPQELTAGLVSGIDRFVV